MKMRWVVAAGTLALAGCGGGGGGGNGPALALEDLQGFWTGAVTGSGLDANKVRAVVLDDGQAWLFLHDAATAAEPLVGLARATLAVSGNGYTGTGIHYPANRPGIALGVNLSGSGAAAESLTVTATGQAGSATATGMTYDARYETAAKQADVVGEWRFTEEGGTRGWTWNVAANGALTGSSTTGCVYTGQVVPHAKPVAVYTAQITESCTGGVTQLAGIARLNSTGQFLTFGLTTSDKGAGEAFATQRVNPG